MAIVARDDAIRIERLQGGGFGNNVYLIVCRDTNESVLIDAPGPPGAKKIKDMVAGTDLKYILLTHSHRDHIGALFELRHNPDVPVGIHHMGAKMLPEPPEVELHDGDVISFGKIALKVLHTPGHTPDSVCFYIGNYLMSGDTLFHGGPGKTSSPEALQQIIDSINKTIFALPDEIRVFPGHGESALLKEEKEEFAIFCSRSHDPNLCGDVVWLSS